MIMIFVLAFCLLFGLDIAGWCWWFYRDDVAYCTFLYWLHIRSYMPIHDFTTSRSHSVFPNIKSERISWYNSSVVSEHDSTQRYH